MIAKIDHLAVGAEPGSNVLNAVRSLGFTPIFEEKAVPNPANKEPLTHSHGAIHGVCLLSAPGSINLEVVTHETSTGRPGFLRPIFRVRPDGTPTPKASGTFQPSWAHSPWGPDEAPAYIAIGDDEPVLREVAYRSPDPGASATFWEAAGFRDEHPDTRSPPHTLSLRSPLHPAPPFLQILEGEPASFPHLDDLGFNCVSLISTDVRKDMEALEDAGGRFTEIDHLELNGRRLCITFGRGPGNELVELVEVQR